MLPFNSADLKKREGGGAEAALQYLLIFRYTIISFSLIHRSFYTLPLHSQPQT
jgi:hypothetical protein